MTAVVILALAVVVVLTGAFAIALANLGAAYERGKSEGYAERLRDERWERRRDRTP